MAEAVRILHFEDDPADAELVRAALEADGLRCAVSLAGSGEAFRASLERGGFDLIITDFSLPGFDGREAVRLARQLQPDVPCLLVSGAIGEEAAVEMMRAGAVDYVSKANLQRLAPAARRALAEAATARELKKAEAEKARLSAQFQQAQKLEAVGLLAGGIAHDFNNIVATIVGNNCFLLEGLRRRHPLRPFCLEIERYAELASTLTQQLLALGRKREPRPRVLDPNSVLLSLAKMLRRLVGEKIDIRLRLHRSPWPVRMDGGQLEQIVLNLVVNARDAMPKGGRVTLATRNQALAGGRFVALEVEDTGTGMSPETRARIFEPFFTTKAKGHGTGLGLATVQSIVEEYHGRVEVESRPGQGSLFRILLPGAKGGRRAMASGRPGGPDRGGRERIMVVEDNEGLRSIIGKALRRKGYRLCSFGTAEDALAYGAKARFDLLLTDVVLPEMDGLELAKRLRQTRPGLPVAYVTGYAGNPASLCQPGDRSILIEKPFSLSRLTRAVRRLLDS